MYTYTCTNLSEAITIVHRHDKDIAEADVCDTYAIHQPSEKIAIIPKARLMADSISLKISIMSSLLTTTKALTVLTLLEKGIEVEKTKWQLPGTYYINTNQNDLLRSLHAVSNYSKLYQHKQQVS